MSYWPYIMAILQMTYILFTALTGEIGVIKMTEKNKEKLFTQAEVDNIVKERLERERKRYNSDNDMVETLQKELVTVRAELQSLKADNEAKATALKAEQVNKTIIQELEKANGINSTELARLFINNTSVQGAWYIPMIAVKAFLLVNILKPGRINRRGLLN